MASVIYSAAIDLGATSGRVIVGAWNGRRLVLTEVHRFANAFHGLGGHDYWDLPRLWHEIRTGLAETDSCEDNAGEENAGHLSAVTQGDTVLLRPWRAWWLLDDSDLPPQELPLLLAEGAERLGE